ncbi:MAG: MerR family transcriptional regulator [Verrucomicrobia bacterium]|nr:MerR family transcriptional regulator [Verrucomicrobiota bacterium]
MEEIQHTIRVAARRCGLSAHVIRIWEKRYDAVSPDRTDTNRRLYSEDEIERLSLLRIATHAGHSIGNIARLPTERLRKLVTETAALPAPPTPAKTTAAATLIESAIAAIQGLDAPELEQILGRGAVTFGQHGLLEKVIGPLAVKVGDLWRDGTLTAAHEHFASALIRSFLARHSKPFAVNGNAPVILVATPAGQLHEVGAVMVAAAANDLGWRVVYLGVSLPAVEIASAAQQHQARAVALSIVYPEDDPNLPLELETLRKHLPAKTRIILGGRAAGAYRQAGDQIGAIQVKELRDFYKILESIRRTD